MNVEDRLYDALSVYREQVAVSPGLLGRIETNLERRSAWSRERVLRPVAVALVVLAVLAVSVFALRTASDGGSSEAAVHQRAITGANRTCDTLTRALADARVVLETPSAYESVAGARADIAGVAAERIRRIKATGGDREHLAAAIAYLQLAATNAQRAKTAAASGDLIRAREGFTQYDGAIERGRAELVLLGATGCHEGGHLR
jgi:hypothetical protein